MALFFIVEDPDGNCAMFSSHPAVERHLAKFPHGKIHMFDSAPPVRGTPAPAPPEKAGKGGKR